MYQTFNQHNNFIAGDLFSCVFSDDEECDEMKHFMTQPTHDTHSTHNPEAEEQQKTMRGEVEILTRKKRLNEKIFQNLDINPLVKEEDDYLVVHPDLPKIPFSMYLSGSRGSGKGVASQQLLDFYNGFFDTVILWCPTANLDFKWRKAFKELELPWIEGTTIFFDYCESTLCKIMEKIEEQVKGKPFSEKTRTLFIFDDLITQLPKGKKNTIFNRLLLNNRHYNASVMVVSQKYNLVDTMFRCNCSQMLLWKTTNSHEKLTFYEELGADDDLSPLDNDFENPRDEIKYQTKVFNKIYKYAGSIPHSFLYINYHSKDPNRKFFRNFDEPLNIQDFQNMTMKQLREVLGTVRDNQDITHTNQIKIKQQINDDHNKIDNDHDKIDNDLRLIKEKLGIE